MKQLFVFVALLGMLTTAFAQKSPPHMARRFRFFGADGGTLVQLAIRPDVQRELKVSDKQKAKIADVDTRMQFEIIDKMTEMQRNDKLTANEMRAGITAIGNRFAEELLPALSADQRKRLRELLLQQAGYLAVHREDVQHELGLTEQQTMLVKKAQSNALARLDQLRERMMKETMTAEQRKQLSDSSTEAHKSEIEAALTPAQRAKFKEMQGETFEFDSGG